MMTTYVSEGETIPVTSHLDIIANYRDNGTFKNDLLALIPLVFFVDCSKQKFFRILYLVKIIRIAKAIAKIDIVQIRAFIK